MRLFTLLALALAAPLAAQVTVTQPVVQIKAHDATQAYALATITSPVDDAVTLATSPVAAMVMIHLTRRDAGGAMRGTGAIPLRARQPRALSVHGYHVMLLGLRTALRPGQAVPVRLTFAHSSPVTARFVAR